MKRMTLQLLTAVLAITLSATLPALAADAAAKDVTRLFVNGGPAVDDLRVVDVSGILVIRGRTNDRERAAEVGRYAQSLGYQRIANLIQIAEPVDDERIERVAERELAFHRSLDGCRFSIDSQDGVVHIAGKVQHDAQRDYALQLVRNIDGVKSVQSDLRADR